MKIGINSEYFLEDFPGSMGGSTDSELSVIVWPGNGTTRRIPDVTMTEKVN